MGRRSRPPVRGDERTASTKNEGYDGGRASKKARTVGAAKKAEVERVYVGGMDPSRGITVSRVLERLRAVEGVSILSIDECHRRGGVEHVGDDEGGGTFFFANVRLVDDGRKDSSSTDGRRDGVKDEKLRNAEESMVATGKAAMSARDVLAARYHNVKWRGCRLRIEPARMTFLERLALEIEERKRKRDEERMVREAHAVPSVGEEALQQPGKTATRAIRRYLRMRRRYGEEAFHVDTKPRRLVVTAPSGGGDGEDAACLIGAMGRRRRKLERLRTASATSSDGAKGGTGGGGVRDRGGASSVRAMHIVFHDDGAEEKGSGVEKSDVMEGIPDDGAGDVDAASSVESLSSSGGERDNGGEVDADNSTDESEFSRDGGDDASSSDGGDCHHSGEEEPLRVTQPPQKSKYVWSDDEEEEAANSASSSKSSPSSLPTINTPKDRNDTDMPVEVQRCDPSPSSSSPSPPPEESHLQESASKFGKREVSAPQHISTGPIDSFPSAPLDDDSGNDGDGGGEDDDLAQEDGRSGASRSSSSSSSSSTDTAAASIDGPFHDATIPPGTGGRYVWSDDDDDDKEGEGVDVGDVRTAPPPWRGIDKEGLEDADHPEGEEPGRDWDIDRDVSRNLDVLAGLFPDMAKKAEAARRDLQKKCREEEEAREMVGLESNCGDRGASLEESLMRGMKKAHDEDAAAAVPSVLMRRYDPANVQSARLYEVVGSGEAAAATMEVPTVEGSNARKANLTADGSDCLKSKDGGIDSSETDMAWNGRRKDLDDTSDSTGSKEIVEEAGDAADTPGDLNGPELGLTSASGTEWPMARIYEQDRLERIFSQSRSKEEDGRHRHISKDELEATSSSSFTFAFTDLSPPPSRVMTGSFSSGGERDGDQRSGRGGVNDAGVWDGGGSGGGFSFEFQIEGGEKYGKETKLARVGDGSSLTRMKDAPNGKASDAEVTLTEDDTNGSPFFWIRKSKWRGLFFPDEQFLNDMEAAFFDMNGSVERIASGGETASAETEAWFRERRALTLDWKRKQKRALAAPRRNRQRRL